MESGDDEDVEDAGFLEVEGFGAIEERTVAEKHRAEDAGGLRGGGEVAVELGAEAGTGAGEEIREGGRRDGGAFEKFRGAEGGEEMDVLASEEFAAVKGAGVAIDGGKASEGSELDGVAGVEIGERSGALARGIGEAHTAAKGKERAFEFNGGEIGVEGEAPGKRCGLGAESGVPAKRRVQEELGIPEAGEDVIGGEGKLRKMRGDEAEREPGEEGERGGGAEMVAEGKEDSGEEEEDEEK